MKRATRLGRIGAVLQAREHEARQGLAEANGEVQRAEETLQSVLEQCRATAKATDLPLAAGMAVVGAGLAEADAQEMARRSAQERAAEHHLRWRMATSRNEAATRLLDRWRSEAEAEADKHLVDDIDDMIAARNQRRPDSPGMEDKR